MKRFSKWLTFALALVLLLVPTIASAQGGNPGNRMRPMWRTTGLVTAIPGSGVIGEWTVNGVTFQVTASTVIDDSNGAIAVGVRVEAEGTIENGQKIAARVKSLGECQDCNCDAVAGWRLTGKVTTMPANGLVGVWIIAGQKVVATDATRFHNQSALKVGATVVSAGVFDETGQRQAKMINILPPPHDSNAPMLPQWELFGQVVSRPAEGLVGTWVIAGQTVITTVDTRLPQDSSALVVGAKVHASGDFDDGGRAVATALGAGGAPDGGCGGGDHPGGGGHPDGGDHPGGGGHR